MTFNALNVSEDTSIFNIVPIQALPMDDNEYDLVGFSILLNSNKMSLGEDEFGGFLRV